ncbi:MAG: ribosome maturation factor RimP [Oscillospiraceae bacterium]
MAKGKKNTAQFCTELAGPLLEQLGLTLWDVRFEKEGAGWFLRFFIDKEGGVDINDCEAFSRAIELLLDEADPIEQSYCLEVSSPGIERELTRPWQFAQSIGRPVTARLIRPRENLREIAGTLLSYSEEGVAIIETEQGPVPVAKGEAASIRLQDDYDYTKGEGQ